MIKLGKRRFEPDDAFFEEGNMLCRLLQEKYISDGGDVRIDEEKDEHQINCQIQGCFKQFVTLSSYEEHYASRHKNVCQSCGKILPTNHLLEIHLNEQHNPMFDTLARKSAMYKCLVSGCDLRFRNAMTRKKHLIEVHKYPSSYRFERISLNKSRKSEIKPPAVQEDVSMDTSEDLESDKPQSRFKYNYKVPASFSFGQGVQKGFTRRRPRSKGNHLVKPKATPETTLLDNIEDIDMGDLATALDTVSPATTCNSNK